MDTTAFKGPEGEEEEQPAKPTIRQTVETAEFFNPLSQPNFVIQVDQSYLCEFILDAVLVHELGTEAASSSTIRRFSHYPYPLLYTPLLLPPQDRELNQMFDILTTYNGHNLLNDLWDKLMKLDALRFGSEISAADLGRLSELYIEIDSAIPDMDTILQRSGINIDHPYFTYYQKLIDTALRGVLIAINSRLTFANIKNDLENDKIRAMVTKDADAIAFSRRVGITSSVSRSVFLNAVNIFVRTVSKQEFRYTDKTRIPQIPVFWSRQLSKMFVDHIDRCNTTYFEFDATTYTVNDKNTLAILFEIDDPKIIVDDQSDQAQNPTVILIDQQFIADQLETVRNRYLYGKLMGQYAHMEERYLEGQTLASYSAAEAIEITAFLKRQKAELLRLAYDTAQKAGVPLQQFKQDYPI